MTSRRPAKASRFHDAGLRGVVLVIVAALVASACGSTVPQGVDSMGDAPYDGLQPGAVDAGLALPTAPANGSPSADPGSGMVAPVPTGSQGGGAAVPGRPGARATTPPTAPGRDTLAASGRGFTAGDVRIGVPLPREAGAANRALGFDEEPGDPRRYLRLVVDEVNRNGGIAGREVIPVVFEIDETSAQTFEQQYQAACAYWTEDEPVFAVVLPSANFIRDSLRTCLDRRDVALWASGYGSETDGPVFERFGSYVEISSMHLGRLSGTLAVDLAERGFFQPKGALAETRLGVVRYDLPTYERAVDHHLEPALATYGIKVEEEVAITQPQRVSDVGTVSAEIGNAVLRFNSRGISHVVVLESSGLLALLFMRQAEAQGYRPRYGLHSANGGQDLANNIDAEQLHDALGIGHLPITDVPAERTQIHPGRRRCLELMQHGGAEASTITAELTATALCDGFFLLQQSTSAVAGRPLSTGTLVDGLHAVGESFPSARTPRVAFSRQRHDGAAAYRRVVFFEECSCFDYTSDLLPTQ